MANTLADRLSVTRPMWRLAIPVLGEHVLVMLVGFVDTGLAGRYLEGEAPLAAIGLMAYTLWLIPSMFSLVSIGATAVVARHVGARKIDMATKATHQALLCGAVVAGAVMFIFGVAGENFVALLNLEEEAADLASRYLRYMIPIIPAIMVQSVGVSCLRGAGDTVSGLVAMAVMNAVNVLISISLVLGLGPAPRLGWDGLALGTAIGHVIGALIVLGLLMAGRAGIRLRPQQMRPDLEMIRRILRVGIPGGVDLLTILTCHLWFLGIINGLGTVSAAAHSLAIRIESIAYLPGTAFQVAAATLAGQYLGAKDHDRAFRGTISALAAGGSLMIGAGFLFYFGGGWLTQIFIRSSTTPAAELTIRLLRLAALAMPSLAIHMILSGALRGAGDTRWPFAINLAGLLGVRIPIGIWLATETFDLPLTDVTLHGIGLGAIGAWGAMVADVVLRSALILWRFLHGGWKQTKV